MLRLRGYFEVAVSNAGSSGSSAANRSGSKFPISWSDEVIQNLRDMSNEKGELRSPIDGQLAAANLLCVDGNYLLAEDKIIEIMRENAELIDRDRETFISVIFSLYVVQRFDLLAAKLRKKFGFNGEFHIEAEEDGPGLERIRW